MLTISKQKGQQGVNISIIKVVFMAFEPLNRIAIMFLFAIPFTAFCNLYYYKYGDGRNTKWE